jgi:DNA/RNA-binding domain of Phe-tRNA-synthetase-like protein
MRFAQEGEEFLGIGMEKPINLQSNQVILIDEKGIIAVYPSGTRMERRLLRVTKTIHIVSCGVPNIEKRDGD